MATTFTYVSLSGLQTYDSLIKPWAEGKISDAVKSSLKTVSIEGNTLKFYNVDQPVGSTAPVFSIDLPQQDLSNFLTKFDAATVGDVVIIGDDGKVIKDSGIKLSDLAKTTEVETKISDAKSELEGSIDTAKKAVEGKMGSLEDLATTAKDTLVNAINENKAAIEAAGEAGAISVDTTVTSEGMLKSYTIKQGAKSIATIDIPKDMVVKSGVVETDPTGQPKGTYLVLTLANAAEDKIYINVGTLVDIYVAQADATQIQLAINPTTREISATIVAGSVGTAELADGAITTVKIADGNVTKTKLSTELQASIDKAESAVQEADLESLKADVAANKASLAEGGATANAIKAAADAAKKAQDDVDAVSARVDDLEAIKYVEATEAEIKALFPTQA